MSSGEWEELAVILREALSHRPTESLRHRLIQLVCKPALQSRFQQLLDFQSAEDDADAVSQSAEASGDDGVETRLQQALQCSRAHVRLLLRESTSRSAEFVRPMDETAMLLHFVIRRLMLQCVHDLLLLVFDSDKPDWFVDPILACLRSWWWDTVQEQQRFLGRLLLCLREHVSNIFSLLIEDKLGLGETARSHADKQGISLLTAYHRMQDQDAASPLSYTMGVSLYEERTFLVRILLLVSWNVPLEGDAQSLLLDALLQTETQDPVAPVLLASFLASAESTQEHWKAQGRSLSGENRAALVETINCWHRRAHQHLLASNGAASTALEVQWRDGILFKCTRILWTVYFRRYSADKDALIGADLQLSQQRCEECLDQFIVEDALPSLKQLFFSAATLEADQVELGERAADVFYRVDRDYAKTLVLTQLQQFALFLTTRTADLIRRMKTREEDVAPTGMAQSWSRLGRSVSREVSMASGRTPRKDIESLLELMAFMFRGQENAGLELLDPRRRSFLKQMYDDRLSMSAKRCYFQMIASLCCGDKSALAVNEILGGLSTTLSWDWILRGLDWYAAELGHRAEQGLSADIQPDDLAMIRALLNILRSIARYSASIRVTLFENFDVLRRLFNLLSTRCPKLLKASIFETLNAFCLIDSSWGSYSFNIINTVWQYLENVQVLPPSLQGGIVYDLNMIEAKEEMYSECLAFLALLNRLIRPFTNRPFWIASSGSIPVTRTTFMALPDILMRPETPSPQLAIQTPWLRYYYFVLAEVMGKIPSRNFALPAEKWSMLQSCLQFAENVLSSYNLAEEIDDLRKMASSLERQQSPAQDSIRKLFDQRCRDHVARPGYHLMSSLLSGSHVWQQLLSLFGETVPSIEKLAVKFPSVVNVALHGLRIILRALDLQALFLKELPSLLFVSKDRLVRQTLDVSSFVSLDERLLLVPRVLVNIMDYVNFSPADDASWLSVKIFELLSSTTSLSAPTHGLSMPSSSAASRLAIILFQAPEIHRITAGYVNRLMVEETVSWNDLDQNSPVPEEKSMANMIRASIVSLFHSVLQRENRVMTVAHLLLGFDPKIGIQDTLFKHPRDWQPGQQTNCLNVLMDLLNERIDSDGRRVPTDFEENGGDVFGTAFSELPIFLRHSELYVRALELIVMLCQDSLTSQPCMRYLRYGEDFFCRQLRVLDCKFYGMERWSASRANALTYDPIAGGLVMAQLARQALILRLVCLEMHTSYFHHEKRHGERLVQILFSMYQSCPADGKAGHVSMIRRLLRSALRIEFVTESVQQKLDQYSVFRGIDLNGFRCVDDHGCEVLDLEAVMQCLQLRMRQAEGTGNGAVAGHSGGKDDIVAVIRAVMVQNICARLYFWRSMLISALKDVVEIAVAEYFSDIPKQSRLPFLFDCIEAVLDALECNVLLDADLGVLTETLMTLISRIRFDTNSRWLSGPLAGESSIFQSYSIHESDFVLLFERVLKLIISKIVGVDGRGHLYSALVRLLQSVSIYPSVRGGLRDAFCSHSQRILDVLCADAIAEGVKAWKVVALTLLENLMALAETDTCNAVLNFLRQRNIVRHMTEAIRTDEDIGVAMALENEKPQVTEIFIFEAKMMLMLRICCIPDGLQTLVNSKFFDVLMACSFLRHLDNQRGLDGEWSSFHQILRPVLNLFLAAFHKGKLQQNKVGNIIKVSTGLLASIIHDHNGALTLSNLLLTRDAVSFIANWTFDSQLKVDTDPVHQMGRILLKFSDFSEWTHRVRPNTEREMIWFSKQKSNLDILPVSLRLESSGDSATGSHSLLVLRAGEIVDQIIFSALHYYQRFVYRNQERTNSVFVNRLSDVALKPTLSQRRPQFTDQSPSLGTLIQFIRALISVLEDGASVLGTLEQMMESGQSNAMSRSDIDEILRLEPPSHHDSQEEKLGLVLTALAARQRALDEQLCIALGSLEFAIYLCLEHLYSISLPGRNVDDEMGVSNFKLDFCTLLAQVMVRIQKLNMPWDRLGTKKTFVAALTRRLAVEIDSNMTTE